MGLARRRGHGGHLCLHLHAEGGFSDPAGPKRCETMRNYYKQLIESGATQSASGPQQPNRRPIAQTLGPQ